MTRGKTPQQNNPSFLQRFLRRDEPEAGPVTLGRRRIYILPTRNGVAFAMILLAMLLGAVNYQNSLAFAFTFLLTALAVVSIIHTFRNMHALTIRAGKSQPVFAGDPVRFTVNVDNTIGRARYALHITLDDQPPTFLDLPQNGGQWVTLSLSSQRRGLLHPGRITLFTRYPLGLFLAWSFVHLEMPCLVYPRPAMQRSLPLELLNHCGSLGDRGNGSDDFSALRNYQAGDSLHHVHWKAVAREQGLMIKQFGGGLTEEVWLRWEHTVGLPLEDRLSLLTGWILDADSLGLAYGLSLPDSEFKPARSELHRHHCLKALALFGMPESRQ